MDLVIKKVKQKVPLKGVIIEKVIRHNFKAIKQLIDADENAAIMFRYLGKFTKKPHLTHE